MEVHAERPLKAAVLLHDIAIGMSDGIIILLALSAGLSGAAVGHSGLIIICLAGIATGAVAMGTARYFTGRSEVHFYPADAVPDEEQASAFPENKKRHARLSVASSGFSSAAQHIITKEMTRDCGRWAELMAVHQLHPEAADRRFASGGALRTGLSYIVGGLIPLAPYFFIVVPANGLRWSCCVALASLFVLGFLKAALAGRNGWRGAWSATLTGSAAAAAAFFIGHIFRAG